MSRAIAVANNDVVQLVCMFDQKIPGCLGLAIERKAQGAADWEPLPAWVGFEGQSNDAWTKNTTQVWPVQKFEWKDVTALRGGTYVYRITPVGGEPSTTTPLTPIAGAEILMTAPVTLTPDRGSFKSYFNRGILSTQFLVHQVPSGPSGAPNFKTLLDRIDQPGDPLRLALAGQILEGLLSLLERATEEGGSCYAALYELTDPELEQALLENDRLHIILSNTEPGDKENAPARQALHDQGGIEVIDRFVPSGHIGHNKFVVYVDEEGAPRAVLLGSTNWTDLGVCAQANNALIVENANIAASYFDYWQRLKADTTSSGKANQGPELRQADARPGAADIPVDEGRVTVWFSPNTPHARSSHPGDGEATPPDLQDVFDLMDKAQEAILFLVFQPGNPSIVDHAADVANSKPNLFIRGAATDPNAVENFDTTLIHRAGEDPVEVVPVSAIEDQFAFWQRELLKAGPTAHAVIHDKIIVIDPMSENCVVVTGSHNQGFRASYNNDENMMIVKGHKELAQAYAVHVMDIYDHYRFRYVIQRDGAQAFSGLRRDDGWQDKYFDPNDPASRDREVWFR
jgi:hypothetical protein